MQGDVGDAFVRFGHVYVNAARIDERAVAAERKRQGVVGNDRLIGRGDVCTARSGGTLHGLVKFEPQGYFVAARHGHDLVGDFCFPRKEIVRKRFAVRSQGHLHGHVLCAHRPGEGVFVRLRPFFSVERQRFEIFFRVGDLHGDRHRFALFRPVFIGGNFRARHRRHGHDVRFAAAARGRRVVGAGCRKQPERNACRRGKDCRKRPSDFSVKAHRGCLRKRTADLRPRRGAPLLFLRGSLCPLSDHSILYFPSFVNGLKENFLKRNFITVLCLFPFCCSAAEEGAKHQAPARGKRAKEKSVRREKEVKQKGAKPRAWIIFFCFSYDLPEDAMVLTMFSTASCNGGGSFL